MRPACSWTSRRILGEFRGIRRTARDAGRRVGSSARVFDNSSPPPVRFSTRRAARARIDSSFCSGSPGNGSFGRRDAASARSSRDAASGSKSSAGMFCAGPASSSSSGGKGVDGRGVVAAADAGDGGSAVSRAASRGGMTQVRRLSAWRSGCSRRRRGFFAQEAPRRSGDRSNRAPGRTRGAGGALRSCVRSAGRGAGALCAVVVVVVAGFRGTGSGCGVVCVAMTDFWGVGGRGGAGDGGAGLAAAGSTTVAGGRDTGAGGSAVTVDSDVSRSDSPTCAVTKTLRALLSITSLGEFRESKYEEVCRASPPTASETRRSESRGCRSSSMDDACVWGVWGRVYLRDDAATSAAPNGRRRTTKHARRAPSGTRSRRRAPDERHI